MSEHSSLSAESRGSPNLSNQGRFDPLSFTLSSSDMSEGNTHGTGVGGASQEQPYPNASRSAGHLQHHSGPAGAYTHAELDGGDRHPAVFSRSASAAEMDQYARLAEAQEDAADSMMGSGVTMLAAGGAAGGLPGQLSGRFRGPTDEERMAAPRVARMTVGSMFGAVVLSLWDHIMGPRTLKVWQGDTVPEEITTYVTKHTLNGEICRPETDTTIEPKFYMLPEIANLSNDLHIFSLSLVMPIKHAQEYLQVHAVCEDRMVFFVRRLQAHLQLHAAEQALNDLSPVMLAALDNLNHARQACITDIDIAFTAFGEHMQSRVLTSHLQTCMCSVVVGSDLDQVNAMINTLALFMPGNDRQRCRLSTDLNEKYNPELMIQGLFYKPGESWVARDEEIILNRLPSTIIDLNTQEVHRTNLFHQYKTQRNEFLDSEINRLKDKIWTPTALFRSVKDAAPSVKSFLHEISRIRPGFLQEAFAQQFQRLLTRRAMGLIKYLEAELNSGTRFDRENSMKLIKSDLGLNAENDFFIVLAIAERLRAGTFVDAMGDPRLTEAKLANLLNDL
ncbi:hypothetical protein CAOG_006385 [Capsaspora owczarzaki ATCC 30864]|uniref:Uncharacterized protein n=1 Tax=Capsaspora owczarzaki (strain ATCC 30864) TaxID=595528 RepID=A0A0D2WTW9_CAPO3|nr:hypothetical protein CAOG_006385 [Capsaspora owczarzaki ATCC 30864]